jgi:uncharacterized membrane protein YccC
MNFPSLRDWIFSLKTFLAGMLALYIAFYFDLPRPYWALASVYIVSNPFVGATRLPPSPSCRLSRRRLIC